MSELSIHELAAQHGEILPEREALGVVRGSFNTTTIGSFDHDIIVTNHSTAVATQSHTFLSYNNAEADQVIVLG
jgi:hypothetical protein